MIENRTDDDTLRRWLAWDDEGELSDHVNVKASVRALILDALHSHDEVAHLRSRCVAMVEALLFYATAQNWRTTGHPQIDADDTPINHDNGEVARNALNQCNAAEWRELIAAAGEWLRQRDACAPGGEGDIKSYTAAGDRLHAAIRACGIGGEPQRADDGQHATTALPGQSASKRHS